MTLVILESTQEACLAITDAKAFKYEPAVINSGCESKFQYPDWLHDVCEVESLQDSARTSRRNGDSSSRYFEVR